MNIPEEQFRQQAGKLVKYVMERLNIKFTPSKLVLKKSEENAKEPWGYTGHYNPNDKSITLFVTDRHHVDILRTLAHELIHHWQNETGNLIQKNKSEDHDPQYAQKDPHLRKMEKQAYLLGNMIFRDFEDIERHGETDIVKENVDPNWSGWVNSMVLTVQDMFNEAGSPTGDVYEAYDIIKTNFRADAPSRDMFEKACKEAINLLKVKGVVK